jgi:hypothetical protein
MAVLDDAAHNHVVMQWIQVTWPSYNGANGTVFPAVGDIDGDGYAEIVAGLGEGAGGWYQFFGDVRTNFSPIGWGRTTWDSYNAASGETHPALGDMDGDGVSEVILGLGRGGGGWLQIGTYAGRSFQHRAWLQITWDEYNVANGATFPAAGDMDADGRAELVVGLGSGSRGWLQQFDDAAHGFAMMRWIQLGWSNYEAANGETHPALGNIDNDPSAELLIGLGEYANGGGWFQFRDDDAAGVAILDWRRFEWEAFERAGGATFPALGRFR